METNEKKERYSDAELEEFKALILEKIAKAERDLEIIRGTYLNHAGNGTEDTSPTFKPFEEGSETMSKEANAQLAARQEKFIRRPAQCAGAYRKQDLRDMPCDG